MKKLNNKKGFTLIEMLVVIAIIAILVAIIIPTVTSATTKANAATDAANLRSAKAAITIKVLDDSWDSFITTNSDAAKLAKALGVPATAKSSTTDNADAFNAVVTPASVGAGATVKVYYGNHAIAYYASIANGDETPDTGDDKT